MVTTASWSRTARPCPQATPRSGPIRLGSRFGTTPALSQAVPEQAEREGNAVNQITLGQAAWFLHQAVDPFQAADLHPARRAFDLASDEAEANADAGPPDARQMFAPFQNQTFTLGRADGNKHQVWFGFHHGIGERLHFGGILLKAEIGALDAGNLKTWKLFGELGSCTFCSARITAKEENPTLAHRGSLREATDEVGASHTFGQRRSLNATGPNQGGAIADAQLGIGKAIREELARMDHAHVIEVDRMQPTTLLLLPRLGHQADALAFRDGMRRHTHQVNLLRWGGVGVGHRRLSIQGLCQAPKDYTQKGEFIRSITMIWGVQSFQRMLLEILHQRAQLQHA